MKKVLDHKTRTPIKTCRRRCLKASGDIIGCMTCLSGAVIPIHFCFVGLFGFGYLKTRTSYFDILEFESGTNIYYLILIPKSIADMSAYCKSLWFHWACVVVFGI
jgi:hypothetical protein